MAKRALAFHRLTIIKFINYSSSSSLKISIYSSSPERSIQRAKIEPPYVFLKKSVIHMV
jgi:hypothetical protein